MNARSYSEMVAQWQENRNFAEVFSGELEFLSLSNKPEENDAYGNMPLDSTLETGDSAKYFLIRNKTVGPISGVIIMFCHYDDENRNKYYIWAKTLAERTGKSVVIPEMRCHGDKKEYTTSLVEFYSMVREGKYPLIDKDSRFDIFANGNGIDRAISFLSSNVMEDIRTTKILFLDDNSHEYKHFDHTSGRFFRITLDQLKDKPEFYAKRDNPVQGYSSLNLNFGFDFSTNNLFPVQDVMNVDGVDYQFDKVFKMASWYLCGIN